MAAADGAIGSRERATRTLARLGRPAGVVFGLALAIHFLRGAGVHRTLDVVRAAGPWLPLLVLLQALIVGLDAVALRSLLAEAPATAPLRTWFRATAIANACSVFLPAGRAAGEALRAAALAQSIGASRAAGACARLQACSLLGTSTACAITALVTWRASASGTLAGLLALNALVCAALGGAVLLLVRSARLMAWLRQLLARLVRDGGSDAPSQRASTKAYAFCVLGRMVQAAQYGVAVFAVGGRFDGTSAFTAQGIHLLGASAGDLLPGQLGAMEGVYSAFADVLGLSDAPARALSLVLVMRGALVGLALAGLLVALLLPKHVSSMRTS